MATKNITADKKKFNKIGKGEYGYINRRKMIQTIYTLFCFTMALSVFFVSYFISGHTRNNVGTVLAIVMTLPACKQLVGVILIFPYKTLNKEYYDEIEGAQINGEIMYDMVLTSNEKPMCINSAVAGDDKLVMLVLGAKQDKTYIKSYFQKVMNAYQLDADVVVCDNIKKYIKAAGNIKQAGEAAKEIKKTVLLFAF